MADLHDKEAVQAAALMASEVHAAVSGNIEEGLAAQMATRDFAEKVLVPYALFY